MSRLPEVDAFLARSKPFAQPILSHIRETVHRVVPEVDEQIKWSRPFFVYRGVILGNLGSFKEHCSFGLWGTEIAGTLRKDGLDSSEGMGTFGKLSSLDDLPPPATLERYIQEAADRIANGARTRSIQRVAKPGSRTEVEIPEALTVALQGHRTAAGNFARMSPSCRREYAEWIASAKAEATRARRVATALEWIAEGKGRNHKYEKQPA